MKYTTYRIVSVVLVALVVIEALCLGTWFKRYDRATLAIVYLVSGLLMSGLVLFKYDRPTGQRSVYRWWMLAFGVFWLAMQALALARPLLAQIPVTPEMADMLPVIQTMGQRWLNGGQVYAVIPEIWGGMLPIYLPAMWMPFLPGVMAGFDPRWTTLVFMIAALVLPLLVCPPRYRLSWAHLLVLVPAYYLWQQFLVEDNRIVAMCEEGVVVGWYALLAWALWRGESRFIGVAIALCALSRYSFIGWLPAYFIWVWLFDGREKAIKTAIAATVTGVVLMVASQAIFHLSIFLELPGRYVFAIFNEWYKVESVVQEGLGLARFFPTQSGLVGLSKVQQILTFGVPLLLVLAFWRWRDRLDAAFFPIALLKISLVVFYNLLFFPWQYLFFTSSFVSLALLCFFLQERGAVVGMRDKILEMRDER
jgi:hypothetical protein